MSEHELKLGLARLLPDEIKVRNIGTGFDVFFTWVHQDSIPFEIKETEWLHVCWLIEEGLTPSEGYAYHSELMTALGEWKPHGNADNWPFHMSWQQRATAILKVKGGQGR